ncbi:MAG: Rieske (2Fe-2S) protein [Cyclobacteriaceae bacterium]
MDKRQFLKSASAATVLVSFGLTLASCSEEDNPAPTNDGDTKTTVDLTDAAFAALGADGGWVLHPSKNILLVNVGGAISAFTSVCTHSRCSRDWSFGSNAVCTCHGSAFNAEGVVVNGPATRNLARISVVQDGNTLTLG